MFTYHVDAMPLICCRLYWLCLCCVSVFRLVMLLCVALVSVGAQFKYVFCAFRIYCGCAFCIVCFCFNILFDVPVFVVFYCFTAANNHPQII